MDRVQLSEKMRSSRRESSGSEVAQKFLGFQPAEDTPHFSGDEFRVAEGAIVFRHSDRAEFTGPAIDVLKQMAVNCLIMAHAKAAYGQGLASAFRCYSGFKKFKGRRIAKIWNVLENR